MPDSSDHKSTVREEFTKQATAYAANASVTDPEKVDRLIRATDASADARVLEVATGPGHVAFGFAEVCDEVVGIDLTEAPLAIAEKTRRERGITNVHFQKSDAETLPFNDNTFDIVICWLAFHHFENSSRVLQQMARVCRPDGTVGVADLVVSKYPERRNSQNRFEQIRNSSHTRALSLSGLIELFTENGVEVHNVKTGVLVPEVEQWLSNAQTPESRVDEIQEMVKKDANEDLSRARPFWQDGDQHFVQRTAIITGRRLEKSAHNATSDAWNPHSSSNIAG